MSPVCRIHAVAAVARAAVLFAVLSGTLGCHRAEKAPPRAETPPILVDDAFQARGIGLDLDLLEDPTGALTITDVRSPEHAARFSPSTNAAPNFGFTKSAYWARFSLRDARDRSRRDGRR